MTTSCLLVLSASPALKHCFPLSILLVLVIVVINILHVGSIVNVAAWSAKHHQHPNFLVTIILFFFIRRPFVVALSYIDKLLHVNDRAVVVIVVIDNVTSAVVLQCINICSDIVAIVIGGCLKIVLEATL
jgi:hypothetical protein